LLLLAASLTGVVAGQSLRVYSEFQRIDPSGNVVKADRGSPDREIGPREILSPALVRNGYTSFHIVVSPPRDREYYLFVVQNPEDALQLKLYKESYAKRAGAWIPETLTPVALNYRGRVPDSAVEAPDQTHESFLLEIFVPAKFPVDRVRVEAQLNAGDRWIIYPMELRVIAPVVPGGVKASGAALGAVDAPADVAAAGPLQAFLCGQAAGGGGSEPLTIRSAIRRGAEQDMALARMVKTRLKREVGAGILKVLGSSDKKAWCAAPSYPRDLGAEWYLKVRDLVYRSAEVEPE
jgi:hypothetical protein